MELREYLATLRKWVWLIVTGTLIAGGTAFLVSLMMPPVYEAKAGVVIVRSKEEVAFEPTMRTLSEDELLQGGAIAAIVESRRDALKALVKTSTVATLVISDVEHLLDQEDRNVNILLEKVKIESEGDFITIKVRDTDPTKAAAIANAWASRYEEYVNGLYGEASRPPGEIDDQVAQAWTEYQTAEAKVIEFIRTNDIDKYNRQIEERQKIIQQLTEGISARTAFVSEELTLKRGTLEDLYSTRRKLDRLIEDARALHQQVQLGVTTASTMIANALSQILIQASAYSSWADLPVEIQLLAGELPGTGSPDEQSDDLDNLIGALEARRADVQADIAELSTELVTNAGYEFLFRPPTGDDPLLKALAQRYPQLFGDVPMTLQPGSDPVNEAINALQDEIDSLRQQLEQETATQQELIRARDLAWETYSALSRKAGEVEVAAQAGSAEVRLAMPAIVPEEPVAPRKRLNTLLASVVGAMLAIGAVFLIEYLDNSISTAEDVAQAVGLPTLGSIVAFEAKGEAQPVALRDPLSPAAESFRMLRTRLEAAMDETPAALLIASPTAREGKSTIAANLAVVLAQANASVILVDSDLRRPVQHTLFGLSNDKGLSDILAEDHPDLDHYLCNTEVKNLRLFSSGPLPPNPSELLQSARIKTLVDELKSKADVVIFDSPAILAVTDADVLGKHVDGVLLVIEAGRTEREPTRIASERLATVGSKILGVVLNKVSPSKVSFYYYKGESGHRVRQRILRG